MGKKKPKTGTAKEGPKLVVRMSQQRKSWYKRCAKRSDMPLSSWVKIHLDAAARLDSKESGDKME